MANHISTGFVQCECYVLEKVYAMADGKLKLLGDDLPFN